MTRIYTNVPAMIARANLGKNMNVLQTSLERLSTGFKINSGKDDPAGLIASEMLRSDITGIRVAIKNTERANMMIATADSALNEVTNLLNDIRGLITEAANTGAMSAEMIKANQLQVDASLDAIDRIAAQTTFMGQKLLDGSLDFNYYGIDRNNLQGLAVNQASFGANQSPLDVVINVREAAEKAALYYNQPALAETIVLSWGGNYGYSMQTFEKGATVAEIAEIINRQADSTGVVAEIGSDALAGLLYVSSLGHDNDMIIRAGLEGLNAGNVEIKYLKGSSEGIQVMYEEPLFPGAPAKILVYLQTEAYEAAFADDVDTTWTMKDGKLVPLRDNNALKFEANIEGGQYNGANIYYVDGWLTDPNFRTDNNQTGSAGMPYAYYSDNGQSSTALFGNVPGAGSTGVNDTGFAFDLGVDEYFAIQAKATGSEYNNVNIQFVSASPGDSILNGQRATAVYTEQLNPDGTPKEGSKTLTIYYNNDGDTTLQDVQNALKVERHMDSNGNLQIGAFEVKPSIGTKKLDDVSLVYRAPGQSVNSNTHNSGGAAGSLFIVMPPDGKMPKSPDVPEQIGVTAKPISNGNYLAHKDAVWDDITFNFVQNSTVPGNNVVVFYDEVTNTLSITAEGDATYDDILDALNGSWASGKPSKFNDKDLFWSDSVGNPKVPDVPRLLASTTSAGVVGKSLQPVATVDGVDLYLYHDNVVNDTFGGWTFEFTQVSVLGKDVETRAEGKVLQVSYGPLASYSDILAEINDWADSLYGPGPHFDWIDGDGNSLSGWPFTDTTAAQSKQNVLTIGAINYRLEHDSPAFNGFEIRFVDAFGTNPLAPPAEISRSGSVITVTYNSSTASVDNILTALNGSWGGQRPAGVGDFYWFNMSSTTRHVGSLNPTAASFDGIPPGTGAFVAVGNVQFTDAATSGADNLASASLRTINTGTYLAKTNIPVGDSFYLAHTNSEWDKYVFNFSKTGLTGGSVHITFDGTNITVDMDDDATYAEILNALNNPFADPPTGGGPYGVPGGTYNTLSNWKLIDAAVGHPELMPQFVYLSNDPAPGDYSPIPSPGLHWVNAQNITVDPAIPMISSAGLTTNSGVYRPLQYSADGRSTLVGDGMYLQHTDPKWDNLDIKFASSGNAAPTGNYPPIRINFDGKMVTVIADTDVTYDEILAALNDPHGTGSSMQVLLDRALTTLVKDPGNAAATALLERWGYTSAILGDPPTIPPLTPPEMRWLNTSGAPYSPPSQLPTAGDLRWVDATGYTTTVTTPVPAMSGAWSGTAFDIAFTHDDPQWDGYTLQFRDVADTVGVHVEKEGTTLIVTYDGAITSTTTWQDVIDALNGPWSGKPTGMGNLTMTSPNGIYTTPPASFATTLLSTFIGHLDGSRITLGEVTYKSNANRPNPPLNHVVNAGAVIRDITANDIAAIFDLDNPMSRGSERAASLFTVTNTVDNDGTGLIRLYDYWVDINGNPVKEGDLSAVSKVITKTAFEKIFGGGHSGGDVITTAAELVTALNNSAYWGMIMCPELIAELAKENVLGKYYDLSDPPVITAQLAPGNHGLFAISTFEEVAYYGNPDEGTALQFLGGNNSPNIRFVVDGPNSQLSIDRTTVPAVVSQAQAVLTAQDSGASLTITAAQKGGDYDDVQFVFKRASEDASGVYGVDRRDGWVEYDPGTSFAFAQATFTDAATNQSVANSAFYVTATERGDMYNNVDIVMRLDEYYTDPDPVTVTFDAKTGQLRISIDSLKADTITTNDIITAINNANVNFNAELSYSEDPMNDGSGVLNNIGLSASRYTSIANTGKTGGHVGGTVTVWLADENPGPGAPDSASPGVYRHPTQEDIVRLINNDPVVSKMFVAKAYNTPQSSDGKQIDFVKDGPIVTSGGLVSPAVITVHLATDKAGNVTTTAADLAAWWNTLDPTLIDGISASIVRPPGAVWDDCDDPYGKGILGPTVTKGDCDEWIINDIQFVGWDDNAEQLHYVSKYSTGTMTSQRGINSSYQLIAKNLGPLWDGYTIEYINNESLTGRFADNLVDGSNKNPCDDPYYSGLLRDDCGYLITPNSTTEKGLALLIDEATKKITIDVKFGVTTANDIMQLINSDPRTRKLFEVVQLGDGTGLIHPDDNTLLTNGGAEAPGSLNGAKLLFGSDATDYYLIFKSMGYGSGQFVDVRAEAVGDGKTTTFTTTDKDGKKSEKAHGTDADVLINGMQASVNGLDVSLNTSALSVDFTLSEFAGTTPGWESGFTINGGGATFQVGPDVVSRQQITLGIRSINTVQLGGASGVLNQLRSGQDADLFKDTNKAFRIVQESLLAITSIRGRLGTMQRATLETNINVLNDTLVAITEAESQIRDTDFAEETSNLTRAQILVQANMNTLGIANQIPNYMLSLLGR